MKELKDGIGAFAGYFPGLGYVLTGIPADRLNLACPRNRVLLPLGLEPFSNP
jgi:hypothetical protein